MAKDDRTPEETPVRNTVDSASDADLWNERLSTVTAPSEQDIHTQLMEQVGALRFINSALMTCIQALQQQDAEMDADIALVLQRVVGDKLDLTIDLVEAIALGIKPGEVEI